MFTADIAEFLTGTPLDPKYSNQAKELLDSPAGQMFKPFLTQMQSNIQKPPQGFYQ